MELAERLGVSRQAVAKWEAGETTPDINNCITLGKLYNVSLDDLINYSEKKSGLPLPPKGRHIFGTATIGERGQIVIPKKAREVFDLNPGDDIVILGDENQGIAIVKANAMLEMMNQINKYINNKGEESI